MIERFYSNGKLLLTGEYVVLDGALSLAVPTKYGQGMTVKETDTRQLLWKSLNEKGEVWFEGVFDLDQPLRIPDALCAPLPSQEEGRRITETLVKILDEAKKLNTAFLSAQTGYEVETRLDFPRNWGLGTSSTLINNIAQWAGVDAYELLWKSFSGSGYDIACAQRNGPILYQLKNNVPLVKEAVFDPPFKDRLYFVFLNKKQNSREGIAHYRKASFDKGHIVRQVSEIAHRIISCTDISVFESLILEHETLLAHVLGVPTIKESLFPDFDGAIKSLGAWGGDFIWAVGNENTPVYFNDKGFKTSIPYPKMVL